MGYGIWQHQCIILQKEPQDLALDISRSFRSFVSAGEPGKGIVRLWLAKLTPADASEVHIGCVQTFFFWMFTDLDIAEQALLVLVTGVGNTGCAPGRAREGWWSTDEAGPYFLLEPLRCFRCHADFCTSVLNRSWDLFGRNWETYPEFLGLGSVRVLRSDVQRQRFWRNVTEGKLLLKIANDEQRNNFLRSLIMSETVFWANLGWQGITPGVEVPSSCSGG